jgi:hypothetical protein
MPAYIQEYPEQWIEKENLNNEVIEQYFGNDNFKAIEPDSWKGNIFHQRRQFSDGQLLFIVNYDPDAEGEFHFEIAGRTAVCLDPFTGDYKKFPVDQKDDKLIIFDQLPPNGSLLLFISNKNISAEDLPRIDRRNRSKVSASNTTVKQNSQNMLTLDYCDLEINGSVYKDIYFYNAEEKIFEHHLKEPYGFNYNPWSVAVQYRTRILDKNNFEKGSGFIARFPFQIETGFKPSNTRVVIEWPHLYTIRCNGTALEPIKNEWWLDHSFGVFDISDQLKPGRNIITLEADPMISMLNWSRFI